MRKILLACSLSILSLLCINESGATDRQNVEPWRDQSIMLVRRQHTVYPSDYSASVKDFLAAEMTVRKSACFDRFFNSKKQFKRVEEQMSVDEIRQQIEYNIEIKQNFLANLDECDALRFHRDSQQEQLAIQKKYLENIRCIKTMDFWGLNEKTKTNFIYDYGMDYISEIRGLMLENLHRELEEKITEFMENSANRQAFFQIERRAIGNLGCPSCFISFKPTQQMLRNDEVGKIIRVLYAPYDNSAHAVSVKIKTKLLEILRDEILPCVTPELIYLDFYKGELRFKENRNKLEEENKQDNEARQEEKKMKKQRRIDFEDWLAEEDSVEVELLALSENVGKQFSERRNELMEWSPIVESLFGDGQNKLMEWSLIVESLFGDELEAEEGGFLIKISDGSIEINYNDSCIEKIMTTNLGEILLNFSASLLDRYPNIPDASKLTTEYLECKNKHPKYAAMVYEMSRVISGRIRTISLPYYIIVLKNNFLPCGNLFIKAGQLYEKANAELQDMQDIQKLQFIVPKEGITGLLGYIPKVSLPPHQFYGVSAKIEAASKALLLYKEALGSAAEALNALYKKVVWPAERGMEPERDEDLKTLGNVLKKLGRAINVGELYEKEKNRSFFTK